MSGSHEKLPWLFWVQLLLAAIIAALYIQNALTHEPKKHGGEEVTSTAGSDKHLLTPIGEVAVNGAAKSMASAERTGKEIVEKTCQTCHANGIANAPKLDASAKSAWEERYANGMDSMIEIAKKGKGAMPAKGGDPSLSDAELKDAIIYMLKKAGVNVSEVSKPKAKVTQAESPTPAVADENQAEAASTPTATNEASVVANELSVSSDDLAVLLIPPVAPEAPKPPIADVEVVETSSNVVDSMTVQAKSQAKSPAVDTEVVETAMEVASSAPAVKKKVIDGTEIYKSKCFACHGTGVADAPKLGDKAAWAPRIAAGLEALYQSAINGKGAMPAKGGYATLSDDEIKVVVDYMISES